MIESKMENKSYKKDNEKYMIDESYQQLFLRQKSILFFFKVGQSFLELLVLSFKILNLEDQFLDFKVVAIHFVDKLLHFKKEYSQLILKLLRFKNDKFDVVSQFEDGHQGEAKLRDRD